MQFIKSKFNEGANLILIFNTYNTMKTLTLQLNLYSFDELSDDAKSKACYNHLDFLNMVDEVEDDEKRETLKQYVRDTFFNQWKK